LVYAHFFAESRHNGTKTVVCAPDFSQVSKFADQWVPLHAGSDGAFWQAITHVKIEKDGDAYKAGKLLRANEITEYKDIENGDWKFIQIDDATNAFVVPKGSSGHRWDKQETGKWNTKLENLWVKK